MRFSVLTMLSGAVLMMLVGGAVLLDHLMVLSAQVPASSVPAPISSSTPIVQVVSIDGQAYALIQIHIGELGSGSTICYGNSLSSMTCRQLSPVK